MVVNLKFSKFDDTPWGFRLIGGTDFDYPLTVVKVRVYCLILRILNCVLYKKI